MHQLDKLSYRPILTPSFTNRHTHTMRSERIRAHSCNGKCEGNSLHELYYNGQANHRYVLQAAQVLPNASKYVVWHLPTRHIIIELDSHTHSFTEFNWNWRYESWPNNELCCYICYWMGLANHSNLNGNLHEKKINIRPTYLWWWYDDGYQRLDCAVVWLYRQTCI